MGQEQRDALARMLAEDESFRVAIGSAASLEEAVAIARERVVDATAEDVAAQSGVELTDKDLQASSAGKYPSMDCEYTTPFDMRHSCGQG